MSHHSCHKFHQWGSRRPMCTQLAHDMCRHSCHKFHQWGSPHPMCTQQARGTSHHSCHKFHRWGSRHPMYTQQARGTSHHSCHKFHQWGSPHPMYIRPAALHTCCRRCKWSPLRSLQPFTTSDCHIDSATRPRTHHCPTCTRRSGPKSKRRHRNRYQSGTHSTRDPHTPSYHRSLRSQRVRGVQVARPS